MTQHNILYIKLRIQLTVSALHGLFRGLIINSYQLSLHMLEYSLS